MSTYNPTQFNPGAAPGISAAELNKLGLGVKAAHDELHAHETKALGVAGSHPMPTLAELGAGNCRFAAGTYVGDGTVERSILIGFAPSFVRLVRVARSSGTNNGINDYSIHGDPNDVDSGIRHFRDGVGDRHDFMTGSRRPGISGSSLVVTSTGSGNQAWGGNVSGEPYKWFAWGVAS